MSKTALQNIITKHHEGGKLSQVESAIIRMFDNGQEYKFLESVANELAELQEYKQLYNEMAAKLNSANSKLFEISQIVLAAGGLTQRAPDAPKPFVNHCNPVNGVHAPFCNGDHSARG